MLNETASRVWRVYPNLAHLRDDLGWQVKTIESNEKIPDAHLEWADVVLQEMGLEAKLAKTVHKLGKPFIYDIDDLVSVPPMRHPDFDKLSRPIVRLRTWRTIHNSDVLIVSNNYLKKHYKWAFPQAIEVFGNYVEIPYWEQSYHPNTSDTIRIGWTGSPSHWEDLKFIEPVILQILKDYPNTKFVYCGMGGQRSKKRPHFEYQIGKDIFDLIPDERKEFVMGSPWETFPSRLASLQLDIGLAPVLENRFGKAKTPIKWMEYGINKVPTVASSHLYGAPYIREGVDGIAVPNDGKAWYKAIASLVDSEHRRREMGRNVYKRIKRDFNMKDHVGRWGNIITRAYGRYHND